MFRIVVRLFLLLVYSQAVRRPLERSTGQPLQTPPIRHLQIVNYSFWMIVAFIPRWSLVQPQLDSSGAHWGSQTGHQFQDKPRLQLDVQTWLTLLLPWKTDLWHLENRWNELHQVHRKSESQLGPIDRMTPSDKETAVLRQFNGDERSYDVGLGLFEAGAEPGEEGDDRFNYYADVTEGTITTLHLKKYACVRGPTPYFPPSYHRGPDDRKRAPAIQLIDHSTNYHATISLLNQIAMH
ncbi:hypothetical protein B0H19DRAFT_1079758 [Mycena capillaripes]|nr:hypothetical protein B0H19DRAFT_1079758 [Mycena capillaripes]